MNGAKLLTEVETGQKDLHTQMLIKLQAHNSNNMNEMSIEVSFDMHERNPDPLCLFSLHLQHQELLLNRPISQGNGSMHSLSSSSEKPFIIRKLGSHSLKLYDVPDSDETLELSEKSRSKMLLKEQDPLFVKYKINTKPINYDILNNDYYKRFVRQTDLYSEHAYWKETSVPPLDFSHSSTLVIFEVPKELPNKPLPQTIMRCLELETELVKKKDFVDKETYDNLCKCFTTLEKHCITLEADSQLNHEIFQQENSVLNQNAPSFTQLFELSELKAQSQAKDTVIVKLKEQIKSLRGNGEDSSVKMDMDEIETLNIELEHREQGLVIAALKNELRKLKGKAIDNKETVTHSVDPNVSKDNMEPITPKLLNKRTAHSSYIKHTQEEAFSLRI
ncbi:hypothetical protein Tco_0018053 [Tanacetum coccineum]